MVEQRDIMLIQPLSQWASTEITGGPTISLSCFL